MENTTKKLYVGCLNKLEKYNIDYKNINSDLDVDALIEKIKNIKTEKGGLLSDPSRRSIFAAVLWYCKENGTDEKYKKKISCEIDIINKKRKEIYDLNELNDKEKNNFLEWTEIENVYKKLYSERGKNFTSFKRCVVIALYVLHPPRRIRDYNRLVVKENLEDLDDDKNYYVMNPPYFIFNNFKTKKRCEKIFDVPDELVELLNGYVKKYDLVDKELIGVTEEDMSSKIKNIFIKTTGKGANANILRHSYISYLEKTGKIKNTKERKELASRMGHDIRTQQEIYLKNYDI
jgi:hypothetical protein